jgi:cytochrome P450
LAPVHRSAIGFWVLTRFDDCQRVLRDPRVGKDFSGAARALGLSDAQQAEQAAFRDDHSNMLFADPPDHTRLRGLATRAFTPRTVEALRGRVVAIVDELIDGFGAGEVDLMDALAFPLPVTVIGEMLGVPAEDRAQFRPLVRASTAVLELAVTPEALAAATAARATMEEYFAALVAERRAHPRDDLLTQLIETEDKGDQLSERELISTAILLFAAGFETTTHLIGNSVLALLGDPGQLDRLRDDRSLLRPGVEELLRYDSPVQITARTAYEPIDVAGHDVEAGETVLALLGAANRDPDHFTDPDRLDVGRDGGAALSFGSGIHYCLGAALARLEGQVVLDRLLERFATWELVGDRPGHRDSLTLRGLVDLRVRFTT